MWCRQYIIYMLPLYYPWQVYWLYSTDNAIPQTEYCYILCGNTFIWTKISRFWNNILVFHIHVPTCHLICFKHSFTWGFIFLDTSLFLQCFNNWGLFESFCWRRITHTSSWGLHNDHPSISMHSEIIVGHYNTGIVQQLHVQEDIFQFS